MPPRFLITLAFLLSLIAVGLWWSSPTQQVKRQTLKLIEAANVPPTMVELARSARGQRVADLVADPLHLTPPEEFTHQVSSPLPRDQVATSYTAAARSATSILFTGLDGLTISVEKDTATARFQVDALVDLSSGRPIDGTITVTATWSRVDRIWRLHHLAWTSPPATPEP